MFDIEFKNQILKECVRIQQEKIKLAHDAMSEHQKMANEYGPPRDRYDAFRSQLLRKRDLFAAQYQKALDELTIFEKIDPSIVKNKVEFGSVVITESQKIFIASGMGKINVNGENVFVISTKVPVFNAMKDKVENDLFSINKIENTILQIL